MSMLSRLWPWGDAQMAASTLRARPAMDPNPRWAAMDKGSLGAVPQAQIYDMLEAYYANNGLYLITEIVMYGMTNWIEPMRPLRNPANRVVEFYAKHVWPGRLPEALPIETSNPKLQGAIEQVWAWSNWQNNKQVAVRWAAMFGNLWLKPAASRDGTRVFLQLIRPHYVQDGFEVDERGYVTYARLNIPRIDRTGAKPRRYTTTEVWTTEGVRIWDHEQAADAELEKLGEPNIVKPMKAMGIDFVPLVHVKFRDVGDPLGESAYGHALDKIDEANRQCTRLHQILFRNNKALWALLANAVDDDGVPLPPPRLGPETGADDDESAGDTLALGDDSMISLPGMADIKALTPNINYADALAILNAHLMELERDLPELAYYRVRDMGGDPSGRAVRLLLGDAVNNGLEARGQLEGGLIRAHEMALSQARALKLKGFTDIGSYEAGDFAHRFAERELIPSSDLEKAQAEQAWWQVAESQQRAGVSRREALRQRGFSQRQVLLMELESRVASGQLAAELLKEFEAGDGLDFMMEAEDEALQVALAEAKPLVVAGGQDGKNGDAESDDDE